MGGCGDQTKLDYIQVHRGLDDGVEFFGGTVPISHVIVSGTGDDGLDWDQGFAGPGRQLHRSPLLVDNFESPTESKRTTTVTVTTTWNHVLAPQLTNGTVIGDGRVEGAGVVTRVGTWAVLDGLVVVGFGGAGYDMRNGAWSLAGGWPEGIVVENSCFDGNGENYPVDDNDPKDDSVAGGADFFDEPTLLADAARNNFEEEPGLGDFSTAATGGSPEPDYGLSTRTVPAHLAGPRAPTGPPAGPSTQKVQPATRPGSSA